MTEVTTFYIADFKIDLSQSIVVDGDKIIQVEPKVLKVLLLLAQRQNEVVTHEEIMELVWQGTEVVPNALQRCIAIIRKVLGDDAKSPSFIATHHRIGYRLLAKVRWQTTSDRPTGTKSVIKAPQITATKDTKTIIALVIAIVALLSATLINIFGLDSSPRKYTQLQQITHTDAHESHAIFNPSANYIVFNRYAGACKSHLWAREIISGKESLLTSQAGFFGAVSFTDNGRELVFAANTTCENSTNGPQDTTKLELCWSIASLDFAQALSAPQQPNFRYQCQAEKLQNPKALSNHQYAFLQFENSQYQLMHYDDLTKKLTSLYRSEKSYIYHFDYDAVHKRFVVISRDMDFNNTIKLLDIQGKLLAKNKIKITNNISKNQRFNTNFEPQGNYLLATSNKMLYKIAFDGKIQIIETPQTNLVSAAIQPSTSNLLAIQGNKDIDIAQITIGEEPTTTSSTDLNSTTVPYASLSRSTAQDRSAQYQPDGDKIAFISDRSGKDEIWLWQNNRAKKLTANNSKYIIHDFSWSPDGHRLAWVANDKLNITDLHGNTQVIGFEKPLASVLSWYGENQLLLLIDDHQPARLYLLDPTKNKFTDLGISQVENAWLHENHLIYSNKKGEVYSFSLVESGGEIKPETKSLPQLNGRAMVVKNGFIYSVDQHSFMLNQYDFKGNYIKAVMQLKSTAWKITDLKDNQLLLDQFIAIDHEIVLMQ